MRTLILILLLTLLPFTSSQAATVDIYTGEAVVESKDAADRRRALPLALRHVFEKYSGLRDFAAYPQLDSAMASASSIVLSFHYRNAEITRADGSDGEELRLVAAFSSDRVDELARSLELPLWPPRRDPVNAWVVIDNGLDRQVMPVEFAYAWEAMGEVAANRGLPVNWPAPDADGAYMVDAQLLWGGYTEDLQVGKGTGAMISAARREGPEWNVRSNLTYRGKSTTWRVQNIDLQAALVESMQQAVDQVAAANTIAATDLGTWMHPLEIAGLAGADDYSRCLGYLQQLNVVNQVSVRSAKAGTVTFMLELNALPQYLDDALLDGQVLAADEDGLGYYLLP